MWLKQKKSIIHKFDKIGKLVSYAPEVTAVVDNGKIKKLTGLDLREFDHAIIFKIALMVKKYLSANPAKF